MDIKTLYQCYQTLKNEHPRKYARDLATIIGISEAELTHARTLKDAVALRPDFSELLTALQAVGETKSITRNAWAVHEQIGHYQNLHLGDHAGLVLNPRALDQRLFLFQWKSVFSLVEKNKKGVRHSIQIFDAAGDAILKIYNTPNTIMPQWHALIAAFTLAKTPALSVTPAPPVNYASKLDAAAIEQQWREMTDVHQFFSLLKRHNISRQQAFRSVASDLAMKVDNGSLRELLHQVQADGNEIMIFIGNRGCVQIFTGVVERLVSKDNWVNIFNPAFTLHLMENAISESWITRKPTANGMVTSLELFAADGTQIAQFYGQRSEGEPEQTRWREQLAALTGAGVAA